jgi:hypothetical protein
MADKVARLKFLATIMKTPIFTLLLLLFSSRSFADYYQAPMQEANWEVKRTETVCFLRQAISNYGSAEFVQRAGETLRFSIQEQRRKTMVSKASLKVMPAPWMHEESSSTDHQVYLDQSTNADYGRLSVYGNAAESMIDALLQGQYPTFIYIRDASVLNMEETRVGVSAIHFGERYREFADCRNKLHPSLAVHSQRVSAKVKKSLKPRKKQPKSQLPLSTPIAPPSAANQAVKQG